MVDVFSDIQAAKEKFLKDKATQQYLQKQKIKEEETLSIQQRQSDNLLEVRGLFQQAAKDTQQKLEFHINNLVSAALASVFEEDPYEFQLEFVEKRGKTEADVWFVRNNQKMKPIDASGGGAVDVADLASRIAFWSLTKKTRPLFILDEPFRNLNESRQEKALEMLKMLAEKSGLQIVMVSHIQKLIAGADREFKLLLKNGRSVICQ